MIPEVASSIKIERRVYCYPDRDDFVLKDKEDVWSSFEKIQEGLNHCLKRLFLEFEDGFRLVDIQVKVIPSTDTDKGFFVRIIGTRVPLSTSPEAIKQLMKSPCDTQGFVDVK